MATPPSYKGDVQTKACPHCGDGCELPSEAFRSQCSDVSSETDCCGAIVDWDELTVVSTPEEKA